MANDLDTKLMRELVRAANAAYVDWLIPSGKREVLLREGIGYEDISGELGKVTVVYGTGGFDIQPED